MSLAAPSRVTIPPAHAPGGRAPAWLLLPAAAVCGFGLGLAGLAALAPAPVAAPLPPVTALAASTAAQEAVADDRPDWAPLFGAAPRAAPPPEPVAEAEDPPEPAYDPMDDFDPDIYVLRGLAVATDDQEGFALLETPDTAMIVRAGDLLPEGYQVTDIIPEGIVIDVFGEEYVIGFQEDSLSVDGDAYDGEMGSRYEGPSDAVGYRPRGVRDPDEALGDTLMDRAPPASMRFPRGYPDEGPSDPALRDRFGLSR